MLGWRALFGEFCGVNFCHLKGSSNSEYSVYQFRGSEDAVQFCE